MADKMQPPTGFTRPDMMQVYKADCEKAGRILPYPISFRVDKSNVDKSNPEKPRVIPRLIATYPNDTFETVKNAKPPITY